MPARSRKCGTAALLIMTLSLIDSGPGSRASRQYCPGILGAYVRRQRCSMVENTTFVEACIARQVLNAASCLTKEHRKLFVAVLDFLTKEVLSWHDHCSSTMIDCGS